MPHSASVLKLNLSIFCRKTIYIYKDNLYTDYQVSPVKLKLVSQVGVALLSDETALDESTALYLLLIAISRLASGLSVGQPGESANPACPGHTAS
jgi:hypothetical protein